MPLTSPLFDLSDRDREEIDRWLHAHGTPQQVALRGRIVLAAAQGHSDSAVARDLEINRKTVILWRARFAQEGIDSLWEVAPGRGRKPTFGPEKIKAIVDATLQTKPNGMTHWSCRLMAKNQQVSKSTISNVWRSHNLKPHRVKNFNCRGMLAFWKSLRMLLASTLIRPNKPWCFVLTRKAKSRPWTERSPACL
jgi:transposase